MIYEKTFGPDHDRFTQALKGFAVLLHKMDREREAKEIETRLQGAQLKRSQLATREHPC